MFGLGIPAAPAVLLTVGCYGFAYTGAIARGFAIGADAERGGCRDADGADRRARADADGAGVLRCRYFRELSGGIRWHVPRCSGWRCKGAPDRRIRCFWPLVGFAVWLPADLWFFLAQRQSRIGQFTPFEPMAALARLGRFAAANVFGGLPLYVDGIARTSVTAALVFSRWSA